MITQLTYLGLFSQSKNGNNESFGQTSNGWGEDGIKSATYPENKSWGDGPCHYSNGCYKCPYSSCKGHQEAVFLLSLHLAASIVLIMARLWSQWK